MGMFDEIVCECALPDGWTPPPGTVFQTKDTDDQSLVRFTLGADGMLRRDDGEELQHHGALEFYTSNWSGSAPWGMMTKDDQPPWTAEYVALYDHGRMLKIEGKLSLDTEVKWCSRAEWFQKSRDADAARASAPKTEGEQGA